MRLLENMDDDFEQYEQFEEDGAEMTPEQLAMMSHKEAAIRAGTDYADKDLRNLLNAT